MIRTLGQLIASKLWAQITAVVLSIGAMSPIVSFFWRAGQAPIVKVQEKQGERLDRLEQRDEQRRAFETAQVAAMQAMTERLTAVESDSLQLLRMGRMIHLASGLQHSVADLTEQVALAREQMTVLDTKLSRQGAATEAIRQKVKAGAPLASPPPRRESR